MLEYMAMVSNVLATGGILSLHEMTGKRHRSLHQHGGEYKMGAISISGERPL